ncbi:MAG: serpin family protein [Clostridiales bacterium]|nr:serpin family protein [Clostridiales bacterium]
MKKTNRIAAALLACLLMTASCGHCETEYADLVPDKPAEEAGELTYASVDLPAAGKEPAGAEADALLSDAVTGFSEKFYKLAMPQLHDNAVFSPLSLYYALSLTSNGAHGETAEEFAVALGMETAELNEYLYTLTENLAATKETTVIIGNAIWGNAAKFAINPAFQKIAERYYDAHAESLAFDGTALKKINGWVSEKTDGMIDALFDSLDPEQRMILVNTVLFDGIWAEEYEDADVMPGTFTTADGRQLRPDFLYSTEYSYFEVDGAKGFSKDYKDGYRFIGVRPDGDLAAFVAGMDLGEIIEKSASSGLKADCGMPKFEYEASLGLNEITEALGIQKAFTGSAELGGLNENGADDIMIDSIFQKAKIVLNEHGTKAAAATAINFATTAFMPEIRREVYLDKPFFYAIVNADGIPLFLGTVEDPTK